MKCAFVLWIDSVQQEHWNAAEDIESARDEVSCGLLIREGEHFITLALSHAPDTGEYGHIISIPRVAIKSMSIFTKSNKERKASSQKKLVSKTMPGSASGSPQTETGTMPPCERTGPADT